jgi:hypothetical protein
LYQLLTESRGGGRVKSPETGTMIRAKDASDTDTNVKAIMNAYRKNTLVAVIAGKLQTVYGLSDHVANIFL